ncbi:general transcription factor IIH subunit 2 isoform X2 [Hemiscyllium ocellatum]|uniref:general transcription factor IIH subunit 2 isoform X2 n=1 Tax=Hemiscyllium ocellatum TaxID=170820 RepID=UPI002966F20F|nr:general transcription factor IIH subunit 2 isoform X2 [Hemiscyllium ocellatum]
MYDEAEKTKRWEGGYERTWEVLKEDETGSLKATIDDLLSKEKRKRVFEHHGQVRLGMMRHLYVIIDMSRSMEDQDLKPNRLTSTLKLLEYFVEEYFDQNPISQIGIVTTKNKRAEKLTELAGTYHVILDESHFKELLNYHVSPPPASSNTECSLIRMGFPQHTMVSLSDQDAKPCFSMAHLDSNSGPTLTLGGYYCPQCRAKYTELPVECKVCGLTLVSAPHLARSYHHLFPLDAFRESSLEEIQAERYCQGCQGELKDTNVYICNACQNIYCVECDIFIHDTLHCCPGCIHNQSSP